VNVWEMTTREILEHISSREITATEVLDSYLKRIREAEPEINAFIQITEPAARASAFRVDSMISRGENPGLLSGLPIAVKDNICVRGAGCTCGSRMMENWISPYDATTVRMLRDQGAVIIGKTNLDEFAMGSSTETSAFGPTKNPWDLQRVPGGSSGGSAAAVAAGMAPIALGTDTGGSIRQPASFTGICGIKPTYGLVSRYGAVAFASSLDSVGPFGQTVWDCALALEAIAGHDPGDPTSSNREPVSYTKGLDGSVKGLRVGFPREFLEGIAPEVRDEFKRTLKTLENMGIAVEEISIPSAPYAIDVYYIVATCEASSNLAKFDGVRFGKRAEVENLDDMYTSSRGEGLGNEVIRRIMLGTFALSAGQKETYYVRAAKVRTLIRRDFDKVFEKFDLIVSPATPYVAFKIGEKIDDPLAMYTGDLITVPVNLAGLCALSMPMGFAGPDKTSLPCGLQVIGKPFDDQLVLRLGHALEQEIGVDIHRKVLEMRRTISPIRECELVD